MLRLDTDQFHVGPFRLDGCRNTRNQATTADRYDDSIHVGYLLEQLKPDSPLPGDNALVIESMHQGVAMLLPEPVRLLESIIVTCAVQHDVGTEFTGPVDLR